MSLHCIICDYDLEGLEVSGPCPECGTAIVRSLQGDLLRFADQHWLGTIERGARFISGGAMALLLAILALMLVTLTVALSNIAGSSAIWMLMIISVPVLIIMVAAPIVLMIGLWMMSEPEPREQWRPGMRPLAFRALSAAIVPMIGMWMISTGIARANPPPPWLQIAVAFTAFIFVVAHARMFNSFLQALDRRCGEINDKRQRLLEKYDRQGLGCAVVAAGGAVLLLLAPLPLPGPAIPVDSLLNVVILIWLAVISFSRGAAKRIALERAMAANPNDLDKRKISAASSRTNE